MSTQPVYLDDSGEPIYLDDSGNPRGGAASPTAARRGNVGSLEALMSYLKGASSLVTAPIDVARGASKAMSPEESAAGDLFGMTTPGASTVLKALASLGKMQQQGQQRQTNQLDEMAGGDGVLGMIGKVLALANKSPIPLDSGLGVPLAMQGVDLAGAAAVAAGADFEPPEAMELSRALKSGDITGFMEKLGATTAQIGALGLTGTTSGLGRRLGLPGGGKVAPAGAKAASGTIADTALDTSAISSPILRKNVFPGGQPARSMPVPELEVPVTLGEGTGSAAAKMGERALESGITSAGSFEKLHSTRAQKIHDYGQQVGQFISKDIKTAEGSKASVSLRVQQRIGEAKQVLAENRDALYEKLWNDSSLLTKKGAPKKFSVKDTPIDTVAKELIPELEAVEARIGGESLALKALRSFSDPKQKWVTLRELQSLKQAAFNSGETAKLGMNAGAAKKLSKAIDDTIGQMLETNGRKGLKARWEVAKARHQEIARLDEDKFINGILANNRDAAYDVIKSGGVADVDTVWKLFKPQDRQLVKARWIQDVVESVGDAPPGSSKQLLMELTGFEGRAAAFESEAGRQVLSKAKAKAGLDRIGPAQMQRLFTEQERQAITTFSEAVERYGKSGGRNAAGALSNAYLYYNLIGGLSGDVSKLGTAAAVGGGTYLLGRLLTNPKTAISASKLLDAMGKAGEAPFNNPSVSYWGQRLAKEANESEKK